LKANKYAIVTITDDSFIQGTEVLFYTFLKYNPWFEGDLIILENDLSSKCKKALSYFPNLIYHSIGKELLNRIKILTFYLPHYQSIQRRFYSLEVFNLSNYQKILFLDSDMLFKGNIHTLFSKNSSNLIVVPDYQYFLNKKREKLSYLPIHEEKEEKTKEYLYGFNSGMMMINVKNLSPNTYFSLLKLLNPIIYKEVQTAHTDQYLLNHFFHNHTSFVSSKYNFLLHAKKAIEQKENPTFEEIILIHYSKKTKPWSKKESPEDKYQQLWLKEYKAFMDFKN